MYTIESVDMTGFSAGLRGLANLGIPMSKVIREETGQLIKTLVNISPAAKARRIQDDIKRKFEWLGMDIVNPKLEGQQSGSGIKWVSVNKHYLTGVDPVTDMRKASVEELKQLSYKVTNKGRRIRKDFTDPRTHQKVLILTKLLTKQKTVNALANAKAKNRGRLKAAWLPAIRDGVIKIGGRLMPPQWVTRHARGARGDYLNQLSDPKNPSFTIMNRAKGLKLLAESHFVERALEIRAKAMVANVAGFFKRGKNLADYAKLQ